MNTLWKNAVKYQSQINHPTSDDTICKYIWCDKWKQFLQDCFIKNSIIKPKRQFRIECQCCPDCNVYHLFPSFSPLVLRPLHGAEIVSSPSTSKLNLLILCHHETISFMCSSYHDLIDTCFYETTCLSLYGNDV